MAIRLRRFGMCLLAATVAISPLVGCKGEGFTDGEGAPAQELPTIDINAASRGELADGGTLRWPIPGIPWQWNYLHVTGANATTAEVVGSFMPRLWQYDKSGVPSPNPDYLTRAELTSTTPKQVVTYTINPEATWSDGTPITWRDFESQFNAMNGNDLRYQSASTTGYDQMESVARGAGDREVVVTFERPFSDWQAMFDPLYPASTTGDPDMFNDGWLHAAPVTAGPFRFESFDDEANSITVVRDESFWGGQARLDRIVYRAMTRGDQVEAYANGTLSFLNIGNDTELYRKVKERVGTDVRMAASPDYSVITLNGTSPALSDVKVRRAVARGIDRAEIAAAVLSGFDWPAIPMDNHFYVNTQAGYQDNAAELGEPDPAAAAALLDKAGWTIGKGERYRTKDGSTLTLTLTWSMPSGSPRSAQIGDLVRDMLAEIGIKVVQKEVPAADFFDKYVAAGNFDLAPSAWTGTPYPVSFSRSIYAEPVKDADGNLVTLQNFARIGSDQVDAMIDASTAELDPDRSRELANQADAAIWEQVHSLPLYQQVQIRACQSRLANFGANGFQSIAYEDIGFTK